MNKVTSKEELCKIILKYKEELRTMEHNLFTDNLELFCNRIFKVCEQAIRGYKEPPSCCKDYAMKFNIVKNGLKCLLEVKYPLTRISFEVADHFSDSKVLTFIEANIDCLSGEIDGNIIIMFPVNDEEFEAYLGRYKESADKREAKLKKDTEENMKTIEEKEKEQLKILKEKYETGG